MPLLSVNDGFPVPGLGRHACETGTALLWQYNVRKKYGALLLCSLFLCLASLPIMVDSFLIVGPPSDFNVVLLCHPEVVHSYKLVWVPGSTLSGV